MKVILAILPFFFVAGYTVNAQSEIVGKWKTIDDNTGKERSIVEIYKKGDQFFGKVLRLYRGADEDQNPNCKKCDAQDDRYQKPVIGMEIIRDMRRNGEVYEGGTVLDPESGSMYKCKIWLEDGDLKLRGYVAFFYRTQTWKKFDGEI